MRSVVLKVQINDTDFIDEDPEETLEQTADRLADELTDVLRTVSISANIWPTHVYASQKDEEGQAIES